MSRVVTKPAMSRLTTVHVSPICSAKRARGGQRLIGRLEPSYEFAELHHRYGREEVGPDHGFRREQPRRSGSPGSRGFVASTASPCRCRPSSRNTACLIAAFEHGLHHDVGLRGRAQATVAVMRARAASTSSAGDLALAGDRSNEVRIAASPRWTAASSTSRNVTSHPACAATCAMPNPSDQPQ